MFKKLFNKIIGVIHKEKEMERTTNELHAKVVELEEKENSIPVPEFRMVFKFRDTTTGEIFECDYFDDEKIDQFMGNKHMQLIFE